METNPILSANLSQEGNTPLYFQLETLIKRCISSGLVKAGDLLPSEAEFCRCFGISRSTVRQAIGELEEEGLVIWRPWPRRAPWNPPRWWSRAACVW